MRGIYVLVSVLVNRGTLKSKFNFKNYYQRSNIFNRNQSNGSASYTTEMWYIYACIFIITMWRLIGKQLINVFTVNQWICYKTKTRKPTLHKYNFDARKSRLGTTWYSRHRTGDTLIVYRVCVLSYMYLRNAYKCCLGYALTVLMS